MVLRAFFRTMGLNMMDKCYIVRREHFYDVFIHGKKVGSGQWGYVDTAYIVYKQEGYDVEIVYE